MKIMILIGMIMMAITMLGSLIYLIIYIVEGIKDNDKFQALATSLMFLVAISTYIMLIPLAICEFQKL